MEALAKIRIPGQARQVLDVILRKTYGWHKKEDHISLSQFEIATGLKRSNVCQSIKFLEKINIIYRGSPQKHTTQSPKTYYQNIQVYGFQKDFEKWMPVPKKLPSPNNHTKGSPNNHTKIVPNSIHTKEKKETIQKKIHGEFQNVKLFEAEYQKLFETFGNIGTKERIETLSQYIASKGKKYSSHYATILSWERKNPKPITLLPKKESPPPEIIPKDFIPDPEGQKRLKEIIGSLSKKMETPTPKESETRARLEEQKDQLRNEGLL